MNRFEFYPGENEYLEDVGTILIEKCPVVLITEEEYLSRNGNIIGTGRPDPLAQEFAESFSRHYDDIAKQKPIYLELEGLFRFVALAKTLKYKDVSIELDYFLQQFPISEVPVPSTLAGIPHIEDFEHRQDYQGGYQIAKLWLPSCGGVGIEINVREGNFKLRPDKRLYDLRHTLFESRPSIATLSWPFGRKKRPAIPEDVIMVQGALQQGQSLGWIRNNLPENTSVYAIDQLSKQEIFVLSKEDNEFELFAVYSKHVNSFATGIEAVFQFNEIAREACKRATNKDIKFVHASQEGDDAILQIGKEQIRLASSEITALLNDPISRKPLPIDDVLVLK